MTFPLYESLELVSSSLGAVHTGFGISLPGTHLPTTYWLLTVVPSEKTVPPLGALRRTQTLDCRGWE